MKPLLRKAAIAFCVISFWSVMTAQAQANNRDPVAPLNGGAYTVDNHFYAGYQYSESNYHLASARGIQRVTMSGMQVDYAYHPPRLILRNLALLGSVRYGQGNLLSARMMTGAAGASYIARVRQFQPFVQALGGVARLTSDNKGGDMYLSNRPLTGFTALLGAGLDIKLKSRWGLRPAFVEQQRLPFGSVHSTYVNIGGGVLYYPARVH
jgi:hypothetical protein